MVSILRVLSVSKVKQRKCLNTPLSLELHNVHARFEIFKYSQVPNKRGGGGENNREGVEMARNDNNLGAGIIGGGVLGEIENSRFLSEHVSFIYLGEH